MCLKCFSVALLLKQPTACSFMLAIHIYIYTILYHDIKRYWVHLCSNVCHHYFGHLFVYGSDVAGERRMLCSLLAHTTNLQKLSEDLSTQQCLLGFHLNFNINCNWQTCGLCISSSKQAVMNVIICLHRLCLLSMCAPK